MKVVITGLGVVSSIGNTPELFFEGLLENKTNIQTFEQWKQYKGLHSYLGAPVDNFEIDIHRKKRRSMSKMSEMGYAAACSALKDAGLDFNFETNTNNLDFSRTLLNMASTTGSPIAFEKYFKKLFEEQGPKGQFSTSFLKTMNHSVAANVASGIGYIGPLYSTPSACSSSTHAVILGYELISSGLYDVVVAGGADEMHFTSACVFDIVHAASRKYTDNPKIASRPFDKDRDGLVVSEGAGVVVLESMDHARKRGVTPLAEIISGVHLCDGTHMTQPNIKTMHLTMARALEKINLTPKDIDYVSAHATSTILGDINESIAIFEALGSDVPVSSLKGHLGHTLAACGTMEIISIIQMMKQETLIPTKNLEQIDPACANINLLKERTKGEIKTALSNNFAFGGMNTSVILQNM